MSNSLKLGAAKAVIRAHKKYGETVRLIKYMPSATGGIYRQRKRLYEAPYEITAKVARHPNEERLGPIGEASERNAEITIPVSFLRDLFGRSTALKEMLTTSDLIVFDNRVWRITRRLLQVGLVINLYSCIFFLERSSALRRKTMSRRDFVVKTQGVFFGLKVNTTGTNFAKLMRKTPMARPSFLKVIMPLFATEMRKKRIGVRRRMVNGYQKAMGTRQFESTAHGTHKPHEWIPDPLSRIFGSSRYMHYGVFVSGDKLQVSMKLRNGGQMRARSINFHIDMERTPRVATVLSRLNETCLPYIREGHRDDVLKFGYSIAKRHLLEGSRSI